MAEKTLKRALSAKLIAVDSASYRAALSFTVLSCGDDDQGGPRVGIVYDSMGKGDGSFNDSAYEGVKRAQDELGAVVSEETTDELTRTARSCSGLLPRTMTW